MRVLCCTLLLSFPILATAGGLVWSDRPSGTKAIRACNFDGSNVQNLYTGAGDPRGVIIDAAANRVYFTDRFAGNATSGEINSIPLTGGVTREQHLTALNRPADLRFDAASRTLYWCEENAGLIRRAALPVSGGTLAPVNLFTGQVSPYYLDFDNARGKLFWGTSGNSLLSGPITGGVADAPLYTTGQNMRGVCVDSAGGMIYWVERDGTRAIRRRPIAGGIIENLYNGLDTPHGLVLDLVARKLYWVDTGTQNAGGFNPRGVSRGDLDGSSVGAPEVIVAGNAANQPWDIALDPRATNYAEWIGRFFRRDAASDAIRREADPDNDRLPNLAEYAFGSAPLNPGSTAPIRYTSILVGNVKYPAVTFPRRKGTLDLVYTVETSTDLALWTPENNTVEVSSAPDDEEGMEQVQVRSLTPVTGSPRQFLRVRVDYLSGGN